MSAPMSKEPKDWDEGDVMSLIANGVTESSYLDYKESRALQKTEGKKGDISKDVSAFANAGGGTILYGVAEDKHVPTEIDGGLDPADISKEWLESVINSTIKPRIDGVRINPIALSGKHAGRVLYAVQVPMSVGGHQASDHRYYKRFNFQSVPMEDYEVRDVMRRTLGPDLYCTVSVGEMKKAQAVVDQTFEVAIAVGNRSPEPALYAHIDVFVDDRLTVMDARGLQFVRGGVAYMVEEDGLDVHMSSYGMDWVAPHTPPFWQGVDQPITDRPFVLARGYSSYKFALAVVLRAPHMSPNTYVFDLKPEERNPSRRVWPHPVPFFIEVEEWLKRGATRG